MLMTTLTLPQSMMNAARVYADRENVSVCDLFAEMLHRQYGYVLSTPAVRPRQKRPVLEISSRVRALRGAVRIDDDREYGEMLDEAIVEKHGV